MNKIIKYFSCLFLIFILCYSFLLEAVAIDARYSNNAKSEIENNVTDLESCNEFIDREEILAANHGIKAIIKRIRKNNHLSKSDRKELTYSLNSALENLKTDPQAAQNIVMDVINRLNEIRGSVTTY